MLALGVVYAEVPQVMPPLTKPQAGYEFPAKETLSYAVDWRVFPAGVATFHLNAEGDVQHVSVEADTVGAVNLLFRVTDRFQSAFNRETGCSEIFTKQLVEGRRQVTSTLTFNPVTRESLFTQKNLIDGSTKQVVKPIPPCVTDPLSAIFYAASQPMEVGKTFTFPLADSIRTVKVTMRVEGHDEITTPAGTFQTVRVEPTADAGVVKSRGNIWIWYTNDNRHIPVQMRARLFWGTITFRLTSIEAK